MKTLFKILSLIMAVLFIIAAYLQWNDPDATIWYFVYGIAALASVLFFLNRLRFGVAIILGLLYIAGTVALWPEKWEGISLEGGDLQNVERARESLGLLITGLVMFVYAVQKRLAG
ncbi:MAG: transmembrane 220 family protein [Flavobacteriaceae bacterium]